MISLYEMNEIITTTEDIMGWFHNLQAHGDDYETCEWYECRQTVTNMNRLRELKTNFFSGVVAEPPQEDPLQVFLSELKAKQEPLGIVFEQVLNDNYWDLLVEGPTPTPEEEVLLNKILLTEKLLREEGLSPTKQDLDSIGE